MIIVTAPYVNFEPGSGIYSPEEGEEAMIQNAFLVRLKLG